MSDKSYNGWTNYETWNVNLWLENEEHTYNEVRERILAIASDEPDQFGEDFETYWRDIRDATERWLEEYVDQWRHDLQGRTGNVFDDLLTHALGQVDWREIAQSWMEDMSAEIEAIYKEGARNE